MATPDTVAADAEAGTPVGAAATRAALCFASAGSSSSPPDAGGDDLFGDLEEEAAQICAVPVSASAFQPLLELSADSLARGASRALAKRMAVPPELKRDFETRIWPIVKVRAAAAATTRARALAPRALAPHARHALSPTPRVCWRQTLNCTGEQLAVLIESKIPKEYHVVATVGMSLEMQYLADVLLRMQHDGTITPDTPWTELLKLAPMRVLVNLAWVSATEAEREEARANPGQGELRRRLAAC